MALQVAVLGTLWFLSSPLTSVYDCVGCNINELCITIEQGHMDGWDHQHILFAGAFKPRVRHWK